MRRKEENHELFIYPIYHKKKEIVFQKKIGKRCFKTTKWGIIFPILEIASSASHRFIQKTPN